MDAGWVGGVKSSASPPTAVSGGAAGNATAAPTPTAVRTPARINEARHAASTNTTIPVQRTAPFAMRGQSPRCDDLSPGGVVFVGGRGANDNRVALAGTNPAAPGHPGTGGVRYTHCADFGYVCKEYFCDESSGGKRDEREAKLQRVPPSPRVGTGGVAAQTIRLHTLDTNVKSKGTVLANSLTAGSAVLQVPDVSYMHVRALAEGQTKAAAARARPSKAESELVEAAKKATPTFQWQGILPMDEGPFLRGCGGIEKGGVALPELHGRYGAEAGVASRHAGDDAAFDALEAELRRIGVFDWTPDGILLSRDGESADALEGDVKHPLPGHLFNVAVQGAAHTTSWTSDLPGLDEDNVVCQPGDEVFIAVIADVQWKATASTRDADAAAREGVQKIGALTSALAAAHAARVPVPESRVLGGGKRQRGGAGVLHGHEDYDSYVHKAVEQLASPSKPAESDKSDKSDEFGLASRGQKLRAAEAGLRAVLSDAKMTFSELGDARKAVEGARKRLYGESWTREGEGRNWVDLKTSAPPDWAKLLQDYRDVQYKVRTGEYKVERAEVSNFRLARVTSAQLAANARFDPRDPKSRCGLRLAPPRTASDDEYADNGISGCGEYIIGAWRVGTVLDGMAGSVHTLLPTHTPRRSSMLRIYVNIKWVSSLQLWRRFADYPDAGGRVRSRGVMSTADRVRAAKAAKATKVATAREAKDAAAEAVGEEAEAREEAAAMQLAANLALQKWKLAAQEVEDAEKGNNPEKVAAARQAAAAAAAAVEAADTEAQRAEAQRAEAAEAAEAAAAAAAAAREAATDGGKESAANTSDTSAVAYALQLAGWQFKSPSTDAGSKDAIGDALKEQFESSTAANGSPDEATPPSKQAKHAMYVGPVFD